MAGYETLWVPGTDHASIATEARIVETMRKEGLTKDDLGRDKFLERAWEWKKQYGGRIVEQLKKIVCEEMQNVIELSIPLTVECSYGNNWLEAH